MDETGFRAFAKARGLAEKTVDQTCYALKRVERAYDIDLDKEFAGDGLLSVTASFLYSKSDERADVQNPSRMDIDQDKLYTHLAWYRHKLGLYSKFLSGETSVSEHSAELEPEISEAASYSFSLERDLQAALRADIGSVEAGLAICDGGVERRVDAGLIDILAKDRDGRLVVIELKAEKARPGALTQLLAYMASLTCEGEQSVRGVLVASDFDSKCVHAAKILPNVRLQRYGVKFSFEEASL